MSLPYANDGSEGSSHGGSESGSSSGASNGSGSGSTTNSGANTPRSRAAASIKAGSTITTPFGVFRLGDKIGEGAYAKVYKALDSQTGKVLAVKKFISGLDQDALTSVMKEVRVLQQLDHKHILKIHGLHEESGCFFIFLEYCENGSLLDMLKEFSALPEELVSQFVSQVLQGLVYLHNQEIVHRDLKCANLLINKMGELKIADFGVAAVLEGTRASFTIVGSPYWMAPEIITESGHNTKSDIWSLGCTVIELITGHPPFYDLPNIRALYKVVQSEIPIPENISEDLRHFLHLCLQKDPTKRPTSEQLLEHKWIKANAKVSQPTDIDAVVTALREAHRQTGIALRKASLKPQSDDSGSSLSSSPQPSPLPSPLPTLPVTPSSAEKCISPLLSTTPPTTPTSARKKSTMNRLDLGSIGHSGAAGLSNRSLKSGSLSVGASASREHSRPALPLDGTAEWYTAPMTPHASGTGVVPSPHYKLEISDKHGNDGERSKRLSQKLEQIFDSIPDEEPTGGSIVTLKAHFITSMGPTLLETTASRVCSLSVIGEYVWVGGSDGILSIWNVRTTEFFSFLRLHNRRICSIITFDKEVWVSAEDGNLYIVAIKNLRYKKVPVHDVQHQSIRCLLPVKKWLRRARVWSIAPSVHTTQIAIMQARGKVEFKRTIAATVHSAVQAGDSVWFGCFDELVLAGYKTADVTRTIPMKCKAPVTAVVLAGEQVLAACNSTVHVFNATTAQPVLTVGVPSEPQTLCLFQNLVLVGDAMGTVLCLDTFKKFALLGTLEFPEATDGAADPPTHTPTADGATELKEGTTSSSDCDPLRVGRRSSQSSLSPRSARSESLDITDGIVASARGVQVESSINLCCGVWRVACDAIR
eukprot:TRINITY_DN2790_c0_g1_i4.p1 TRINITY_DN2790_c0_g1~~TRINITY_DN2790_c0_g1_i4.p1  ORF type:complete len:872 (-),score=204.74 TRINITY_DN2790_c0_g1_i4:16-2631(-)